MKHDVCLIGAVTKDINRVGNQVTEMAGGAAFYVAETLTSLGLTVKVVTNEGMVFENIYTDSDHRTQNALSQSEPIHFDQVKDIQAQVFYFGPLIHDDIDLDVYAKLSEQSDFIVLDAQGLTRKVENKTVVKQHSPHTAEILKYVNLLKVDVEEALILSEEKDLVEAAKKLCRMGPEEIVITRGSKGSLVFASNRFYEFSSVRAQKIVDPTGCGDTFMAAYLYQRKNAASFEKAANFAAEIAAKKIAKIGPWCADIFHNNNNMLKLS